MNTARIGVIATCLTLGAIGYLSWRGAETDDAGAAQEIRAAAEHMSASDPHVSRDAMPATDARTHDTMRELAFRKSTLGEPTAQPDASELLPPLQTLDAVVDAVNAEIGPEGEYVDRAALASVLSSDPELSQLLNESEF